MLQGHVIVLVAFAYLGLLFGIAYYADQRADAGRSIIDNATIYALSLAVYATAWTFYGSVGRAASDGIGFLPIYLGDAQIAGGSSRSSTSRREPPPLATSSRRARARWAAR
jgi:Na+/proline symporter